MPIVVVEPLPLVSNIFKLLCGRYQRQPVVACQDFDEVDSEWLKKTQKKIMCIIGGSALRGDGKRFLPLISDSDLWQTIPKLVVVPHDATAEELANWQRLPMAKLMVRPFAPDDFYALVDPMVKGLKL
ncbi:MAG: hypothetical protein COV45_01460 [Deltaproteobacteria bacterium CG11_big_fil_rev_8_21_14_0_20_47_16]|nr:MAG: hypothetical protein COV45_01460 [Deltaproteobacteria bacterium CG11_big_fil_rev_8_21_14_0_20_47_16]